MRQMLSHTSFTERVLGIAVLTSAALLAGAHLFERVGGFLPCVLCLDQREAHWAGLSVAIAGLLASRLFKSRLAAASAVGAAALVYAASSGLAFYHTGVEFGYWPGPASCAAGAFGADLSDIVASLDKPSTGPACEDVQWQFLGVSMAGYNLLISAGLFALTLIAALQESRAARQMRKKS